MNPIQNVGASSTINKVQSATPSAKAEPLSEPIARGRDSVELTGMQGYLSALRANDIRVDKVAEIKAQIEAGNYETDEKLDIAADRLLEDL